MNIINSFKHFIFRHYRDSQIKKHELNYLFWECTLKCNLNCLHCGSDCLKNSEVKDMPIEDFVNVLNDIKLNNNSKRLTVCITGGEPLLRKDLEHIGNEIIKHGFKWGIVTNGLILTKDRFDTLIKSGLSSISFSFDGFENQHNKLRQNEFSFQKVISAIDLVVEYSKNHSFVYDVITCVNKFNFDTLPKFRDFLISKGIKRWRIFSIFPEGRASNNFEQLALNKSEYIKLMDFISETRKKFGEKINLNYSCEGFLGDYELKVRDYFYFCRAGINVASVMCDGNVTGCLSVRANDFIQGNIYKENFMDIWNNKYKIMRDRTWTKQGKCKTCKQWKKCLGNGLHLHNDLKSEVSRCNYEELFN